jgi:hypothetical protein
LSRLGPGSLPAVLLAWLLAPPARAEVVLDVTGSVETVGDALEVRVEIGNRGDVTAAPLGVEGELFGAYDTARIEDGVAAGKSATCTLRFPSAIPRPGLHVLALDLSFSSQGFTVSQRGYLLLALGTRPEPVLRVSAAPARLANYGTLRVSLESTDGAAHRVRLRVLSPRGLNPRPPEQELAVPASGPITAEVGLLRGVSMLGANHGVLLVASAIEGDEERTTVAAAVVEIAPYRPWLPRLRPLLLAVVLALLSIALAVEIWWRWLRPRAGSADR